MSSGLIHIVTDSDAVADKFHRMQNAADNLYVNAARAADELLLQLIPKEMPEPLSRQLQSQTQQNMWTRR